MPAYAGFSQLWQALPNADFDKSKGLLHVSTGFQELFESDTIFVRECYEQLTTLALEMTPLPPHGNDNVVRCRVLRQSRMLASMPMRIIQFSGPLLWLSAACCCRSSLAADTSLYRQIDAM